MPTKRTEREPTASAAVLTGATGSPEVPGSARTDPKVAWTVPLPGRKTDESRTIMPVRQEMPLTSGASSASGGDIWRLAQWTDRTYASDLPELPWPGW
jgi:hypothetical protein